MELAARRQAPILSVDSMQVYRGMDIGTAKPSAEVADKTSLLDLNDRVCRWPMGHPGEPDFHFCGEPANPGYPYCVAHCGVAYQAQLPRRDRRPPPPLPYGGPRVR